MVAVKYWDRSELKWKIAGVGAKGDPGSKGDPGVLLPVYTFPGVLSVKTGVARWYNYTGSSINITNVGAAAGTAPTGSSIIVDVNVNGTTVFTNQNTRPIIANGENVSPLRTVIAVIPADGYVTVDIDQVGSTIVGSDLTVLTHGR